VISDTGVGIPKEYISKLYTPFERIGSEKSDIEGTGLGLAVVKRLVEALGGCCGVESVMGKGSTFWIELQEAQNYRAPEAHDVQSERVRLQISDISGTVLYIEDNLSNYELVEQILALQRPRINMVTNTHGGEAVKLANEYLPSLILLDLNLPDIDGLDVLRLLQHDPIAKGIPVVILSANSMQHEIDKLLKAGAKRYLTKPLEVVAFLSVIDEYVK
jgi:CheY-like chemotaxis protein